MSLPFDSDTFSVENLLPTTLSSELELRTRGADMVHGSFDMVSGIACDVPCAVFLSAGPLFSCFWIPSAVAPMVSFSLMIWSMLRRLP